MCCQPINTEEKANTSTLWAQEWAENTALIVLVESARVAMIQSCDSIDGETETQHEEFLHRPAAAAAVGQTEDFLYKAVLSNTTRLSGRLFAGRKLYQITMYHKSEEARIPQPSLHSGYDITQDVPERLTCAAKTMT